MHKTVKNLLVIEKEIKKKLVDLNRSKLPKIIAVSKTFKMNEIIPLIDYGHKDFGENKVQEAEEKWSAIKSKNKLIKLHMVGKLQSNKIKNAVRLFDYIHSVESKKIAKKIKDEMDKIKKDIKVFIQINIGNEIQKSGISKNELSDLIKYCNEINLNVIGLMCLPPLGQETNEYFKEMLNLNNKFSFSELSMGMSGDYLQATEHSATFLKIGSSILAKIKKF